MNDRESQKYEATITFKYEAGVYDGDPDDVFDLAKLEEGYIKHNISALSSFAETPYDITIKVKPVL